MVCLEMANIHLSYTGILTVAFRMRFNQNLTLWSMLTLNLAHMQHALSLKDFRVAIVNARMKKLLGNYYHAIMTDNTNPHVFRLDSKPFGMSY
jgi:hypothetical protein